jgi:hypothetical protein
MAPSGDPLAQMALDFLSTPGALLHGRISTNNLISYDSGLH